MPHARSLSPLLVSLAAVVAGVGLAAVSPFAFAAQRDRDDPPPPGGLEILDDDGDRDDESNFEPVVIRLSMDSRDFTVKPRVSIYPWASETDDHVESVATPAEVDLKSGVVVLPVPDSGANADVYRKTLTGAVSTTRERRVTDPDLLTGYQSGQALARFVLPRGTHRNLRTLAEYEMTTYELDIDEDRANRIEWPTEAWGDELIASSLLPQTFVESNDPVVTRLVDEWTRGDPKRVKPYVLAKFLAGRVVEYYQPSEGLFVADDLRRYGRGGGAFVIEGFNVDGAAIAARDRRGSPFDLVNLLCAVYRAAGIPARVVVGYDARQADDPDAIPFTAWVEFWLHQPEANAGEWVMVDVIRQREYSSKAPPLDRKWEYFGHHDHAEFLCPLAHHWRPPTAVILAGSPGLWGWLPDTESARVPRVNGGIDVQVLGTPLRGDDEDRQERQDRRQRRGR